MSHNTPKPLVIALAFAALAAPAAGVTPPDRLDAVAAPAAGVTPPDRLDAVAAPAAGVTPPDRLDVVDAGRSLAATAAITPPDRLDAASQARVRPIVVDDGTSFDWTDAGIGFAAAAGLALMGAGSVATARWRRHGRTLAH